MELKIYEKFNPLLPWTINNRMHDKYVIADKKVAIIGGRNSGNAGASAVDQMSAYFNMVWNHKYSRSINLLTWSISMKHLYQQRRLSLSITQSKDFSKNRGAGMN